ncbi:DEAD/DEAH box helicase [Gracilibacillus timonensis]|uniref:DEAD/DEAH box helicase n=1 Tax=Gracilibacillus timonensis TaxID=1816696 RepID=UPI000824F5F4|nr:DEAD/DEAH box helicase family protein [Gracilibacillus timonensis]
MNVASILDGKVLLSSEIPLSKPTIAYLQRTEQLLPIRSIEHNLTGMQCKRCGNQKRNLFAQIDCGRCGHTHLYCRQCVESGRVLACEPLWLWQGNQASWLWQNEPCHWQGSLTPAQQQAADVITQAVATQQKEQLVWAVCGAGKTEMLFPAITKAITSQKRICLATPRADVVRELFPRFCQAFPETAMEALYAGTEDRTGVGQLVISTTHQLIRYQQAFDVMIIDEIDAFPFHHDPTLPKLAARACKEYATNIYLTATPRPKQRRLIRQKKLPVTFVPLRFHGHPLPVPQLKQEFNLRKKYKQHKPSAALEQLLHAHNQTRQLLIFVPTIEWAIAIASDHKATFVHAEDTNRKEKIDQFRQKKLQRLVTTTILERGVTFPSVDVIVLDAGHSVFDEAALVQIAGRAGRSPDDPTGNVWFIHQGKTEAIKEAIRQIKSMNKKGRK